MCLCFYPWMDGWIDQWISIYFFSLILLWLHETLLVSFVLKNKKKKIGEKVFSSFLNLRLRLHLSETGKKKEKKFLYLDPFFSFVIRFFRAETGCTPEIECGMAAAFYLIEWGLLLLQSSCPGFVISNEQLENGALINLLIAPDQTRPRLLCSTPAIWRVWLVKWSESASRAWNGNGAPPF